MKTGLQVGFGSWIGSDLLKDLKSFGVEMIRCDMQNVVCAADLTNLIDEVMLVGLTPLVIIRPEQAKWIPEGEELDVEILNEPDLRKIDPSVYAAAVNHVCWDLDASHRIWAGAISNLNIPSLEWLRKSISSWPSRVNVSVHRYPPNGAGPSKANAGMQTRKRECAILRNMCLQRKWGVSEFGYHTGEQTSGWWLWKKRWHWLDTEIAAFVRTEIEFFRNEGAQFACLYQINDGPSEVFVDHFGIRYQDGTWKPVVKALGV